MKTSRPSSDPRVETVIGLVTTQMAHSWTVPELAQYVRLSPSRLRHLFAAQVGVAPIAYLRSQRLREAARMLRSTHLKVKEIMRATGITDQSHFARDFAAMFGAPPKRYRQLHPHRTDRERNGQRIGEMADCNVLHDLATTQTPKCIECESLKARA